MIFFGKYDARQHILDKDINICSYVLRTNEDLYYRKRLLILIPLFTNILLAFSSSIFTNKMQAHV